MTIDENRNSGSSNNRSFDRAEMGDISSGDIETNTDGFGDCSDEDCDSDHYDNANPILTANEASTPLSNGSNSDADGTLSSGVSPVTNQDSQQTGKSKAESEESLNIARKENMAVKTWRLIMFSVLIITTISMAVIVFLFVSVNERREFSTSFDVNSQKIYESLLSSMDTKLEALDALAMFMVTNAQERNETWPNTSLNEFASKAAKMRILSHAIALQEYKLVQEDERSEWEAYAKANEGWVQETIEVQREDSTFLQSADIPDYDTNHSISIRYGGPVPNGTGPYTPTWQTYPMIPAGTMSAYNWNAIQHNILGPGIKKVIANQKVVIGPVLNFEDSLETGGANRMVLWATRHSSPDVNPREPIIRILYPILDTATGATTLNRKNSKVVGIIAASFYWRSYLENILPNGENGLVVVFANTCNQSFTYQIDGHEAKWLGPGDRHDPQFDDMEESYTFEESLNTSSVRIYGGLPIAFDYCAYTVSTYPSQYMKDKYHTNHPITYTMIAVGIFVFTALVFIGYDKLVSMRQKKVMSTAVQSTTIVSSLFPSNVRDRLMEGNIDAKPVNKATGSMFQPTKSRLRTFLNDGDSSNDNKPIADLFTDTTVLFADIAGFTAWSSVRVKTETCSFSGLRIYPGHGIFFVRGDSKGFKFVNRKVKSLFTQRLNPRKLAWTIMYRRMHKKGTLEESQKKKARKVTKSATKAVVGASLELIKAKRNQKPEVRAAAREAALREVKERSKAKQAAKKESKPKAAPAPKTAAPKQSKAAAKATNKQGAKGVRR